MHRLVAIIGVILMAGCSGDGKNPGEPIQTKPYGEEVFSDYSEASYPRTFRDWGVGGVRLIELAERNAARVAEHSGKCDSILYVGLAESRSAAPDKPVAFVDCANGERFYASLGDAPGKVAAQSDRSLDGNVARAECLDRVKSSEHFPSSVRIDLGSTVVNEQRTTGATSVAFDYTAKNDLGLDVPRHGRCLFPTDGPPEVEALDR